MTATDAPEHSDTNPRSRLLWMLVAGLVIVVIAVLIVVPRILGPSTGSDAHAAAAATTSSTRPTATAPVVPAPPALTAATIAALPEAKYDAVVAGLVPFTKEVPLSATTTVYHLAADAPLFGSDRTTPVARLAANDFLAQPTTVVGVQSAGEWELVLTPAREVLPSAAGGDAPAQTAAWVPTADLSAVASPTQRIVISTSAQTVTIVDAAGTTVQSFSAGIGTASTPTPTGVTGYLEQRYVDASQGTGTHPIQLTSLHSSAADEPYGGSDGGLIGVHYYSAHSGAVSHGCVRLDVAALDAIDALPLGTLVTVE